MLSRQPSVLLAEDDPITREVVQVHLVALGCLVRSTSSVTDAIALGGCHRFDALVLDCQLDGGDAGMVLRALRANAAGPNAQTAAIAMSAELDDFRFDALIEVGFADAMEKPIDRSRLRHALAANGVAGLLDSQTSMAPMANHESPLVLDDTAGLQACGSVEVLTGLRLLLAQELSLYRVQIDDANARLDIAAMRGCVHRMKSALGFCGASELKSLLDQAGSDLPEVKLMDAWRRAIDRLARALRPGPGPTPPGES
ncbi:MAG: response regulator [Pseudomonadota bacterium]|nr:response regulator [Pseudomonadota bacterium]